MITRFKLDNPDEMEATMEITMTLGGWKRIKESLEKDCYESFHLRSSITSLIIQAEKTFQETTKE